MEPQNWPQLALGAALFLYGMWLMSQGLGQCTGGAFARLLRRATRTPLGGVVLGAGLTALVQSSSATTLLCLSLADAGAIGMPGAVGVIMGANIGTTVTGQLLRLAGSSWAGVWAFLSPAVFSPVLALAGAALTVFTARAAPRRAGQVLLGFGLLFAGLNGVQAAVAPLAADPRFSALLAQLDPPLWGVLAGVALAAGLQSSSAGVGLLQALATTGAVRWSAAVPILLGQNIGTCSTVLLASLGGGRAARQGALLHLCFNLAGVLAFGLALPLARRVGLLPFWYQPISMGQIANFHTFFNLATTLLLLPFAGRLAAWVQRPGRGGRL